MNEQEAKLRIDENKDASATRAEHAEVDPDELMGLSFDDDGECSAVSDPTATAQPSLQLLPPDLMDVVVSVGEASVSNSSMHFQMPSFGYDQHQIALPKETHRLQQSSVPMRYDQQSDLNLPMNKESQPGPKFGNLVIQVSRVSLEQQKVVAEQNINFDEISPAGLDSQAHVEESNEDSFSSLSPISCDSSGEDFGGADFMELVNKCTRETQSFINVENTLAALTNQHSGAAFSTNSSHTPWCAHANATKQPDQQSASQTNDSASKSLPQDTTVTLEPLSSFGRLSLSRKPNLKAPLGAQSTVESREQSDDPKENLGPQTLESNPTNDAKNSGTEAAVTTNTPKACSPRSPKDADSDDCSCRRRGQYTRGTENSALDFYEDDSSSDECIASDEEVKENIADMFQSDECSSYEQMFHDLRKIADTAPNRFKFELYNLLYPILAIGYMRLLFSGKRRRAVALVEKFLRHIDKSYMPRVDKLMIMKLPGDLPNRAKKLIYDDNKQVAVSLNEETYYFLLVCMERWSRSCQMLFVRHFDLIPVENNGEPRKLTRIGAPLLQKVFWATPSTDKEASPQPARRKRARNDAKNAPSINLFLPVGKELFTPTLRDWEVVSQKEDEKHRAPLDRDNLPSIYVYTAQETSETIICASFSNSIKILAVGTTASAVHCFSLTDSKLSEVKWVKNPKSSHPNKAGKNNRVLQSVKTQMKRTLYGHQGPVYGCSFAPKDLLMLSCSQDRTVRCWCLQSWNCVVIYPGHFGAIYSVVFAPLGYYFATASDDHTARIWSQNNKKPIAIMAGHLAEVVCCQFHPNRHYLATGSADCTVRLFDVLNASQMRVFSGHRDVVNALCFSKCGKYLMSGADDHFVIIYDVETEAIVRSLSHHTESINCIEIGMDNKLVIVGGQDCQLSIWDFEGLIRAYDADKQARTRGAANNSKSKEPKVSSKDFLINSYSSKGTPFYKLQITARNLVLGFCVKSAIDDQSESEDLEYSEWRNYMDNLKKKARVYKSQERSRETSPRTNEEFDKKIASGESDGGDTAKDSLKVKNGTEQNAKGKVEKVHEKKRKPRANDKRDSHAAQAKSQSDAGEREKAHHSKLKDSQNKGATVEEKVEKCGNDSSDLNEKLTKSKKKEIAGLGDSQPSKNLDEKNKLGLVGARVEESQKPQNRK